MDKGNIEKLNKYARLIENQAGHAVRPYRADGYVNVLNKYGTNKDTTEHYEYVREERIPFAEISAFYEGDGLFSRIIDTPAEEAIKHGFEFKGIKDKDIQGFLFGALDELNWEDCAITAGKWTRLYGGAIIVMLINDGRGIDEPVDWKNIKSIDDMRVYDSSVIMPDYSSMFHYETDDPFRTRGSGLGRPERYHVYSRYGSFTVHDSRCLVFRNGSLPENCGNIDYTFWGVPEYVRIHRAIRDAEIAHGSAVKMLDRSVQAVYKMTGLSQLLATEGGEEAVLKRLETIDMARSLLSSITIDGEGEEYDFRQFSYAGIDSVIDSTCNYLSAVTQIPQTVLFGRAPAGMNATGHSDFENYYNFIQRIQKRTIKSNLRYLLSIIAKAGIESGELEEMPDLEIEFKALWSLNEMEEKDIEMQKINVEAARANVASAYISMGVISPEEVRKAIAKEDDFDVESMLDDMYDNEEELMSAMPQPQQQQQAQQGEGELESPQDVIKKRGENSKLIKKEEKEESTEGEETEAEETGEEAEEENKEETEEEVEEETEEEVEEETEEETEEEKPKSHKDSGEHKSVGVIVVKDGKVLCGTRCNDFGNGLICGAGGHIEEGEEPEFAAKREAFEEFGIIPKELLFIGYGKEEANGLSPYIYLCNDYEGEARCKSDEMQNARFLTLEELEQLKPSMFQPFRDSIEMLNETLSMIRFDTKRNRAREAKKAAEKAAKESGENENHWVTTENNHHVLINGEGEPVAGNKNVVAAMNGESNTNKENSEKAEKNSENNNKTIDKSPKKCYTTYNGEKVEISPEGGNVPCVGFSKGKLEEHADKHIKTKGEFGDITKEEYQQKAIDFLTQPCGGDIIGYMRDNGEIVRFNTKTTEYAVGKPGGHVITYMKAKYNENEKKIDRKTAFSYYMFKKQEDDNGRKRLRNPT